MGVTDFSLTLIQKALEIYRPKNVVELGAQNLYSKRFPHEHKGGKDVYPYASEFYEGIGIEYECVDLGIEFEFYHGKGKHPKYTELDLSKPQKIKKGKDLVTDFGTSEHVNGKKGHSPRAFYNACKTRHDLCKKWGILICENPKTGHWPNHGYNYVTEQFYKELAIHGAIEIIELGEHPAMGNSVTGMNVYCIAKRTGDFPKFEQFKTFAFHEK